MRRTSGPIVGMLVIVYVALASAVAQAGPPTLSTNPGKHAVFPAKGQTAEQQEKDQSAAYDWATAQTGWDPYKAHDALVEQDDLADQTARGTRGQAVGGAARGALLGLAVGAIAHDAGKGAAIGAAAGGLTTGARSRRTRKMAESTVKSADAGYKQQFEQWDRNWVAAMEGKGYTVK